LSDQKKLAIKGGAGFLLSNVVSKGLGFVFILISSRVLGPAEFGILSLGLSIISVLSSLGSFGLSSAIQRFFSGEGEKRREQLFGSVLIVVSISALFFSLCLYFFSNDISLVIFNEPRLSIVLKVLSFGVALNIFYQILSAVLKAQIKIKQIVLGSTAKNFLRVLFLGIAFIWVRSAIIAVVAGISATFLTLLYIVKCVKRLELKFRFPATTDLKKVIVYSLPLILVGFGYLLSQQIDRLMLGWLTSSTDVGIFSVVSRLALIMGTFHSSLVSTFFPLASQAYRNNEFEKLNETYLFISKWVGIINGLVSMIFAGFGIWILGIFGSAYANEVSYQLLLLLSFTYFFGTWVGPTGALLQMSDGQRIEFYNTLLFLVMNIVLDYFFIRWFGLAGAAIGTSLAEITRNIIQIIEIRYFYNLKVLPKESFLVFIVVFLTFFLCYMFGHIRIYVTLIAMVFLPGYMYKKMDKFELEMLKKAYHKFIK